MPQTFIDLTDAERHWNGENDVTIAEGDGLTGNDLALRIGREVEIILTITQMITLFDTVDAWVNGGPAKEMGAVRGRVQKALVEFLKDHDLKVTNKSGDLRTHEGFAHTMEEYMRLHGVRFRLTGDEDRENFLARRARRAAAHRQCQNPHPKVSPHDQADGDA